MRNFLEQGKCFSIKLKNIFATLVDTSKLNGGLDQMILCCSFLLMLFCSWLVGVYVSFVVCPNFLSASSYSNLVLLNISALKQFRDSLSAIIFVSCFVICAGWFDDTSMYINLSIGFLYGRYVLFSKLNVTPKKSASVRMVTISILKSIFLKMLITFFCAVSVCYLFILRRINNPSSLYTPILYFERIFCGPE